MSNDKAGLFKQLPTNAFDERQLNRYGAALFFPMNLATKTLMGRLSGSTVTSIIIHCVTLRTVINNPLEYHV